MTTRKVLIVAPLALIVFLLQSYFWVPTYEQQTRGNPERLQEYITASTGDASLLNPILSADSASSAIESVVFEGLIDRDEDLRFRGRLATDWRIHEEAFFYINEAAEIPGMGTLDGQGVAELLERAMEGGINVPPEVSKCLDNIREIALLAPRDFEIAKQAKGRGKDAEPVTIRVHAPSRIRLTLKEVDQALFDHLALVLGRDYFSTFPAGKYLALSPGGPGPAERDGSEAALAAWGREILPATEHNPVIVFHLRPGVRFHDGHEFDARDVKFTFDAIMDPRNLSPRVADYEPVKAVEVVDPLKV
ncbi:MAG: peptide ABC transporter substrate-binding protein, partial [Deltaproteobacteria bacterium]|nr:peptide ABC transporter substrate-binding protein [Deltaproteobacteria bacterium]